MMAKGHQGEVTYVALEVETAKSSFTIEKTNELPDGQVIPIGAESSRDNLGEVMGINTTYNKETQTTQRVMAVIRIHSCKTESSTGVGYLKVLMQTAPFTPETAWFLCRGKVTELNGLRATTEMPTEKSQDDDVGHSERSRETFTYHSYSNLLKKNRCINKIECKSMWCFDCI
ncbi:Uncharacterized protein Rs2_10262 [Raphanus sativus]|nr:Uncharacterized protein Rs2_10262 [Raphanus sativus]